MITIEAASRSVETLCGLFILIMVGICAAAWYFTILFAKREKKASARREKANAEKIRKEYDKELRQKGAQNFISLYDARERIRELEHELENTKMMLEAVQGEYRRLQTIASKTLVGDLHEKMG